MEKKVVKKKTVEKKAPAKRVAHSNKTAKTAKAASKGELSAPLYTSLGKSSGTVALPKNIFGASWNSDLVHQVTLGMQVNARAGRGRAHTKGRGKVRGGGRKPWRQKGTGRARHGSIRSPIWRGGGTTHGPTASKEYGVRIPKKMKTVALFSVLSRKLKDGQLLFVDELSFVAPKTKDAMAVIGGLSQISGFEKLAKKTGNTALFVMPNNNEMVKKSFQNIGTTDVEEARNLNALDALSYTYVVIVDPERLIAQLTSKLG